MPLNGLSTGAMGDTSTDLGGNGLGLSISTVLANSSHHAAANSTGNGSGTTGSGNGNAATTTTTTTVVSPRNDFFVSQRVADYEVSGVDSLSLEEQEIMANIQELQAQLMQLRAEEEEDSDDDAPATPAATPASSNSQLIVVSNNLPVLLERVPQTGRWKATKTTGGLDKLMCLTGVRNDLNFLWVGWVGQHIPKHEHESVRRLLLQHNCLPVFMSSDVATRQSAFSSDVLWSLFHYVSEPVALASSSTNYHATKRFNKQDWRAYESANESFADAIAEIYNEGDSVWIHDYHLMLLPSLLRQRLPLCHIGWFLHTPFPASDVYCRLPVRAELLRGVLQSDLVGFQTFDYERHFVSTCQRLLGVECSHKGIRSTFAGSGDRDHFTSIGVFPIGISVEPFARAASSVATLHRVNDLHRKFGTKRIILGVDRLDNIKGIPHKLLAMEQLLTRFPEWQHNVVLIQIGISSRSGVVDNSSGSTNTSQSSSVNSSSNNAPNATSNSAGSGASQSSTAAAEAGSTTSDPTDSPTGSAPSAGSGSKTAALSYDMNHHLEMSSESYRNLLAHVNQLVGRINGTFGTLDYSPIHFIHQRVMQHEELCALYDLADVCLVTSTRDGMNLVSHEFVVCQQHFMRRKDERKKAARAAARADSNINRSAPSPSAPLLDAPPRPSTPSTLQVPTLARLQGSELSQTRRSVPSPQISPSKILTEWEGEEGGPGVLIVSEFAGCSQSLSGAIVTNPWNTEDVALSIHQSLSMCRAEREIRQQKLYRYVSSNTATAWSMQFLSDLGDAVMQNKQGSTQLPKLDVKSLVGSYRRAKNRVIILDYDRTLTPQHALLPLAAVGPNFKSLLDTLSADESNTVFIVSARERKFLETWLQGVRVGVAAEDGFFYRMNLSNDREVWKTMSKFQYDAAAALARSGASTDSVVAGFDTHSNPSSHNSRRSMSLGSVPSFAAAHSQHQNYYQPAPVSSRLFTGPNATGSATSDSYSAFEDGDDSSWKDLVLPTMVNFTERTPGSYIEDKESSLTWHYGDADAHFGGWQAKDLQIVLERQLLGSGLEVYQGHKYVSVEHEGCTKAKVLEGILKHLSLPQQVKKKHNEEVDFVMCVCDDWTDDQMFQTLNTLLTESKERHVKKKQAAALSKDKSKRSSSATGISRGGSGTSRGQRTSQSGAASASSSSSGSTAPVGRSKSVSSSRHSQASSEASSSQRKSSTTGTSGTETTRRKSDKPRRRKTRAGTTTGSKRELGRLAETPAEDDELEMARAMAVDEDNKVAFTRLQKVPVRMAENVSIFTIVVGQDVQHSAGRHTNAYAVDSLSDVRKVLKEFADAGAGTARPHSSSLPPSQSSQQPPPSEVAQPSTSEVAQPSTSEAAQPSTSAAAQPPTSEAAQPPTSEAAQPPASEATQPSETQVVMEESGYEASQE